MIPLLIMKQEHPIAHHEEHPDALDELPRRPGVFRDLLLFEYANALYAVPAAGVEGVVPFRKPVSVPGLDPRVHGVIQDRGRIIMVLAHPAGKAGVVESATGATRIVICATARGLIGLPALATRAVGRVELDVEPSVFGVHESSYGAFTYLEPQALTEST